MREQPETRSARALLEFDTGKWRAQRIASDIRRVYGPFEGDDARRFVIEYPTKGLSSCWIGRRLLLTSCNGAGQVWDRLTNRSATAGPDLSSIAGIVWEFAKEEAR